MQLLWCMHVLWGPGLFTAYPATAALGGWTAPPTASRSRRAELLDNASLVALFLVPWQSTYPCRETGGLVNGAHYTNTLEARTVCLFSCLLF